MTKISTKQFTERLKEEGAGNVTISINKIQQYLSNGEGARAEKNTHTQYVRLLRVYEVSEDGRS